MNKIQTVELSKRSYLAFRISLLFVTLLFCIFFKNTNGEYLIVFAIFTLYFTTYMIYQILKVINNKKVVTAFFKF